MKLLFLGDSITEGTGASCLENCYVSLVGEMLGCEAVNYGIGGTRIGRQIFVNKWTRWNYDFRLRTEIMPTTADKVFVFGGTNDYGHGILHLGSPEVSAEDTFCGQLRMLIDLLNEKYGKEKLVFILPLHRFCEEGVCCKGEKGDEPGASLGEYVEAMRIILGEYGIEYIDLYENGFAKPLTDLGDEYTTDGLHPNDKGHRFIAEKICEYLKSKG